jgi:hypothetical protein
MRLKLLTVTIMKMTVVWDFAPCGLRCRGDE